MGVFERAWLWGFFGGLVLEAASWEVLYDAFFVPFFLKVF